ncbi:winged helix DNA-binding domain-containing protein [Streptomyces hirsutus]|uniref:winged helix DNA-binding domain-containing protein n=1 Tax=Streptomyces hirsutus TaxID=35620 RepID=UPI0006E16878|nr:winged helix DNA-binding domain-containing protein [Streptomyces hirsutus]
MTKAKRSITPVRGPAAVLGTRALNRATLARQLLLRRSPLSAEAAVGHLVGLQAQNVKPPYYALAARLDGFTPEALSRPMADRAVARLVTLRSTIHTHTAQDCLTLRPLAQPARDRELGSFRKGLTGVDLDRLTVLARDLVESAPRTMKQLREALLEEWPDADPQALSVAARCRLPLVQITPRGLWGRSGQVTLTTAERWLGRPAEPSPGPDAVVLRYLAAFGPASVKDMQIWAGLTRLREAFDRLEPRLVTFRDEHGVELFDLPDAPRPDPDTPAPPRFLPEFDNLLLSHADRTRVVPHELRGRTRQGNTPYRALLVDGFLAGVWRLDEHALVVEPFGPLTGARRDEITAEGERMLRVMHPDTPYDIRFGAVRR